MSRRRAAALRLRGRAGVCYDLARAEVSMAITEGHVRHFDISEVSGVG
jgi:hypothetical protein